MRGNQASTQSVATEFVIVVGEGRGILAYSSPRGKYAKNWSPWTWTPEAAYIYPSWKAAQKAIRRLRARDVPQADKAKYCTFGEFVQELREGKQ